MHKQSQMQDKQLESMERMDANRMKEEMPMLQAMQQQSADYSKYCQQFLGSGQGALADQRQAALAQMQFAGGSGFPALQGQNWTGNPPWLVSGGTNTFVMGGNPAGGH